MSLLNTRYWWWLTYPKKKPLLWIEEKSLNKQVSIAKGIEHKESCTFRIQTEIEAPFRIFSKYTPANPDKQQAEMAAMKPINLFCSGPSPTCTEADFLWSVWTSWTRTTPDTSNTNAVHWLMTSFLFSISILKTAVVRIFNWYVTCEQKLTDGITTHNLDQPQNALNVWNVPDKLLRPDERLPRTGDYFGRHKQRMGCTPSLCPRCL